MPDALDGPDAVTAATRQAFSDINSKLFDGLFAGSRQRDGIGNMPATILLIEYEFGETQQAPSLDGWQERAKQIASFAGLRWKYWLRQPGGNERGGVYLFDTADDAERAAPILVGSLKGAGARNVRHRSFEVDPGLSVLTRGHL